VRNDEFRNPNDERNLNVECLKACLVAQDESSLIRSFEIRHSFVIRISKFVILLSVPPW
jgi:hypothetical protein